MLSSVQSSAVIGVDAKSVEIECDITNNLPALIIVGLGSKAVNEAKDRIRSAIQNSGLKIPPKRITINLAPADMPKDGTGYDLGIAVSILATSKQIEQPQDSLFIGELGLTGELRPITGVLSSLIMAKASGMHTAYIPYSNLMEANLVDDIKLIGVSTLRELYLHLCGVKPIGVTSPNFEPPSRQLKHFILDEIYGQDYAKRALMIAVAGNHNILFTGPPGTGKSLLAKSAHQLLPVPNKEDLLEIMKVHSVVHPAGLTPIERPFRSPHHSSSLSSLIGGGTRIRPGELSLSHKGVLFLDELPEFHRDALEALRQPLEDHSIHISRAKGVVKLPADFMLIASKNPCPCGYFGDEIKQCRCNDSIRARYSSKLSGPLLDRFDISLNVSRVDDEALASKSIGTDGAKIAEEIMLIRSTQEKRLGSGRTNSRLSNQEIEKYCVLDAESKQLMRSSMSSLSLSARGYMKTLRVARTIADAENQDQISASHIAEALSYRITD